MSPPELARNAPIGDVVHPLVVSVDPVLWHELHFTRLNGVDGFLRDAFTRGVLFADFVHRDKPLVCQHRFDDLTGAGAARHHEFVGFDLDHQAQRFEVSHDVFACGKAIEPTVLGWRFVVDGHIQIQHADHR